MIVEVQDGSLVRKVQPRMDFTHISVRANRALVVYKNPRYSNAVVVFGHGRQFDYPVIFFNDQRGEVISLRKGHTYAFLNSFVCGIGEAKQWAREHPTSWIMRER